MASFVVGVIIWLISAWPDSDRFAVADWLELHNASWDSAIVAENCVVYEDDTVYCERVS